MLFVARLTMRKPQQPMRRLLIEADDASRAAEELDQFVEHQPYRREIREVRIWKITGFYSGQGFVHPIDESADRCVWVCAQPRP